MLCAGGSSGETPSDHSTSPPAQQRHCSEPPAAGGFPAAASCSGRLEALPVTRGRRHPIHSRREGYMPQMAQDQRGWGLGPRLQRCPATARKRRRRCLTAWRDSSPASRVACQPASALARAARSYPAELACSCYPLHSSSARSGKDRRTLLPAGRLDSSMQHDR